MSDSFSIVSTNAPLVEVAADGRTWDLPSGVSVPAARVFTVPNEHSTVAAGPRMGAGRLGYGEKETG
jgi:hypothetical protein